MRGGKCACRSRAPAHRPARRSRQRWRGGAAKAAAAAAGRPAPQPLGATAMAAAAAAAAALSPGCSWRSRQGRGPAGRSAKGGTSASCRRTNNNHRTSDFSTALQATGAVARGPRVLCPARIGATHRADGGRVHLGAGLDSHERLGTEGATGGFSRGASILGGRWRRCRGGDVRERGRGNALKGPRASLSASTRAEKFASLLCSRAAAGWNAGAESHVRFVESRRGKEPQRGREGRLRAPRSAASCWRRSCPTSGPAFGITAAAENRHHATMGQGHRVPFLSGERRHGPKGAPLIPHARASAAQADAHRCWDRGGPAAAARRRCCSCCPAR